ncbi:protein-disulfide isomerase [Brevundimonas bullata]|uniref:Protein-disulfide isomerase n=1 Tax=Brevundimonas bullata TaxID=13160 RepID=A0A7W7IQE5_9CAUL|nr:DsbA family protein [Brevundimonas bullata]MBB4798636.1 protein-disulfide isomerase [Brevundimonas bullata]MBB6383049.1 protein-disulfide isomerase [Brevundimonas bullata]
MATFRYASMSRRAALTAAALAAMATVAGCTAKTGGEAKGDMALGAGPDAKVTVVEYASITCGHCAVWNDEVWPEFKTKYVDTKKVRYVFREFPTPPQDIAVAGFLIARCAGEDKYFDVMHDIMASQKEWAAGVPPRTTLYRTAAAAGLSQEQTEACITDKAAIEEMSNRIKAGIDAGVDSTPTFIINGVKVLDSSLSGLSEAIDAELAKK